MFEHVAHLAHAQLQRPGRRASLAGQPGAAVPTVCFTGNLEQKACRRAPAFAHGSVSTRQAEGAQMCDTLILTVFHSEEFTAPDRAVEAVSGAIPGNAEIRTFHIVLRSARSYVRLMMLHPNDRQSRLLCPVCRGVVRMQIADDRLGLETVEPAEVVDGALEGVTRFERFQVADVLADENVLPDSDGNRVLQMAAHCEHRLHISRHANSQRRVAASAAQDSTTAAREPYDRIVAGAHDRTVMHQKMIGDVLQ